MKYPKHCWVLVLNGQVMGRASKPRYLRSLQLVLGGKILPKGTADGLS